MSELPESQWETIPLYKLMRTCHPVILIKRKFDDDDDSVRVKHDA